VQTVAVGGRQEKLDAASQCNDTAGGVAATNGGAAAVDFTSDEDDVEEEDFVGARSQESDAPTELEDCDPEIHFKRKGCLVKSTKDVLPSVQTKILEKREVGYEKNLNKSAGVPRQESSRVSLFKLDVQLS